MGGGGLLAIVKCYTFQRGNVNYVHTCSSRREAKKNGL
jgi:hypothetical protein